MMTDLFNPTFFMFLGILILVVALVVVYFESKSREQNHKIASMLSLVSTLAEDMNGVKMGLHHLSVNRVGGNNLPRFPQQAQPSLEESNMQLFQNKDDNLIPVSDDESMSDSIGDDSDEESDDEESEDDSDEEESDDDNNHTNIKILTLNMPTPSVEGDDFEEIDDMEDLGGIDEDITETNSQSSMGSRASPKNVLEMLSTRTAENSGAVEQLDGSHINISATDLKTININLDEIHTDSVDYKKLPLPKLRSIVTDKGLVDDASKLKKQELLKLLEDE
jgi:U3 small nucleolar RNA-associated protein 14